MVITLNGSIVIKTLSKKTLTEKSHVTRGQRRLWQVLIRAVILVLIVLALASLYVTIQKTGSMEDGGKDFQWGASQALLHKQNPYTSYIAYKSGLGKNPYILNQSPSYPASAYVFLFPFAVMNWPEAKLSWAISNLIFTIILLMSLQYLYPIRSRQALLFTVLVLIAGASWRTVMANGQHGLFALAFFALALIAREKSKTLSGLLLSLAWLKYTITFPLTLLFLYKQDYKPILVASLVHIALTLFVSVWIGEPWHEFFFSSVMIVANASSIGDSDVFGIVHKYALPEILAVVALVIIALLTTRMLIEGVKTKTEKMKGQVSDLLVLAYLSCVSLVMFFHLSYDFIVLILPLWLVLHKHDIGSLIHYVAVTLIGLHWFALSFIAQLEIFTGIEFSDNIKIAVFTIKIAALYLLLALLYKRIREKHKSFIADPATQKTLNKPAPAVISSQRSHL